MSSASFVLRLVLASAMIVAMCGCSKKPDDSAAQSNPQPPKIVDPYSGKTLMGIVRHAEFVGFIRRLQLELRGGKGHEGYETSVAGSNVRIFVDDYIFTKDVHVLVDPTAGDKTYVNFGYDSYGSRGDDNLHYDKLAFLEIVVRDAATKKQWEAYLVNIADMVSVGTVEDIAVSANYCLAELREDFSGAHYVATVRKKNVHVIVDPNATSTPAYRWDYYENTLAITVQTPEDAERWQERLGR